MLKWREGDVVQTDTGLEGVIKNIILGTPGAPLLYEVQLHGMWSTVLYNERDLYPVWDKGSCECGAKYDRHFSHIHSSWCKWYKK